MKINIEDKKIKDSYEINLDGIDIDKIIEESVNQQPDVDAFDLAESSVQTNNEASTSVDDPDNQDIDIDNSRLANIDKDENKLEELEESEKDPNEAYEAFYEYSKHVNDPKPDPGYVEGSEDFDDEGSNGVLNLLKTETSDQDMIHSIISSANNGDPDEIVKFNEMLNSKLKLKFVVAKRQTILTNPYGLYGIVPLNRDLSDKYPKTSIHYYVRDQYSQKIVTENPVQHLNDFINDLVKAGLNIINANSNKFDKLYDGGVNAIIKEYNRLKNLKNAHKLNAQERDKFNDLQDKLMAINDQNQSNRTFNEMRSLKENVKRDQFAKLFESNYYPKLLSTHPHKFNFEIR